jgi:hypothetical protein
MQQGVINSILGNAPVQLLFLDLLLIETDLNMSSDMVKDLSLLVTRRSRRLQ